MANRTMEALWRWSDGGKLPMVIDASSCALGLGEEVVSSLTDQNAELHAALEILDSVAWAKRLLPNLTITERLGSAAVHPTCSTRHLGLERISARWPRRSPIGSRSRSRPPAGMAGDRGMLHPELTQSATRNEAAELAGAAHDAYLCSNRTCEIGLQAGTGAAYESVLIPLERLSR